MIALSFLSTHDYSTDGNTKNLYKTKFTTLGSKFEIDRIKNLNSTHEL